MNKKQMIFAGIMVVSALAAIFWPPQRIALVKGKGAFYSSVFWDSMDHAGKKMACPPDLASGPVPCSESSRIYYEILFLELLVVFLVGGYLILSAGRSGKWQVTFKADKKKEWLAD